MTLISTTRTCAAHAVAARKQISRRAALRTFALAAALAAGVAATATTALPGPAHAAQSQIFTGLVANTAVAGYDPVAYFRQGKPVKGSTQFTTEYEGATWRFSSAENLAAFKASPAKYAPRYGGYCAYAVSKGYTAKGDPKHWKIVDGKLYLNYNADAQELWAQDIPGNISKGNANWPKVLN